MRITAESKRIDHLPFSRRKANNLALAQSLIQMLFEVKIDWHHLFSIRLQTFGLFALVSFADKLGLCKGST